MAKKLRLQAAGNSRQQAIDDLGARTPGKIGIRYRQRGEAVAGHDDDLSSDFDVFFGRIRTNKVGDQCTKQHPRTQPDGVTARHRRLADSGGEESRTVMMRMLQREFDKPADCALERRRGILGRSQGSLQAAVKLYKRLLADAIEQIVLVLEVQVD